MINPGDRKVTINVPYIKLPDGRSLVTPWPTANVQFPYDLLEGKNCFLWAKESDIKQTLLEKEYSGKVKLHGAVSDATGKVFISKKPWGFDLSAKKESKIRI